MRIIRGHRKLLNTLGREECSKVLIFTFIGAVTDVNDENVAPAFCA
jgi:hypothetical protein